MKNDELMEQAIHIARQNVLTNHGGPFGAIVVKDGVIIGTGRAYRRRFFFLDDSVLPGIRL